MHRSKIRIMLRRISKLNGWDYHTSMLKTLKDVRVQSVVDVLTADELHALACYAPQKHLCYKNAYRVAELLGCEYCEGYLNVGGVPIEHAFNKIHGKYIDVTIEIALGEDPSTSEYATIGEYNLVQMRNAADNTGKFGGVYKYYYIKEKNESIAAIRKAGVV